MPRGRRAAEGGVIYHALNRGNDRKQIFFKPADYLAFIALLLEGLKHADVDVLAFCLMPNHWHLVLRPRHAEDLSKYIAWVTNTHAKRYHEHYHTRGNGHVYQGRFKSFAVQEDFHLLAVLRYVEGNAFARGFARAPRSGLWEPFDLAAIRVGGTAAGLADRSAGELAGGRQRPSAAA